MIFPIGIVTLHPRNVKAPAHNVVQSIETLPMTPIVTESHEPATPLTTDDAERTGDDSELSRLARDIAAGQLRMTVAAIRVHLGCSQAKAIALRRRLNEIYPSFKEASAS